MEEPTNMASCSTNIEGLQAPTSSISTSGDDQESLVITVESSCSKNMQFSEEYIFLTLALPNKLLYTWHKEKNPTTTSTALVNTKIKGRIIRLKCCPRINERLRSQAEGIASRYHKGTYQQRHKVLYHLHVLEGECDHFDDIEHEKQQLQKEITEKDHEVVEQLMEEMAGTIIEHEQRAEKGLVDIKFCQ